MLVTEPLIQGAPEIRQRYQREFRPPSWRRSPGPGQPAWRSESCARWPRAVGIDLLKTRIKRAIPCLINRKNR